ncbi:MAG: hypothetical protein ACRCUM_02315 [Mycoplasmoidaceae bacterium]
MGTLILNLHDWDDVCEVCGTDCIYDEVFDYDYAGEVSPKNTQDNIGVNMNNTQQIKYTWGKLNIDKSKVKVHFKNDDTDSILVEFNKDMSFWFDTKYVIANPYTNFIIVNIANEKIYKDVNKKELVGKGLISLFQ